MCTVFLPPGNNPIAVNKYIASYYYNLMGPPSYMRSIVNRNVVMRRISVNKILKLQAASILRIQPSLSLPLEVRKFNSLSRSQTSLLHLHYSFNPLHTLHMAAFKGDTMSTSSRFSGNLLLQTAFFSSTI